MVMARITEYDSWIARSYEIEPRIREIDDSLEKKAWQVSKHCGLAQL
jgi:hypothetical protein